MKIKRILIIDDDCEYMGELEEFLVRESYRVFKKENTHRILTFIKKIKPDLIILDYKINGLSGIDVSKILNCDLETKDIPIMLVSNYYSSNSFEKNDHVSAIRVYLKKSVSPEFLIKEIRKIDTI